MTFRISQCSRAGRVSKSSMPGPFPPKCTLMNTYEYVNKEGSDMVTATMGLPGLSSRDITINLLHDKLTISDKFIDHQPQLESGIRMYTCRERPNGKFSRVLTVPLGMKPDDFKARMENGLLILTYPKDAPKQEPQRIPIE